MTTVPAGSGDPFDEFVRCTADSASRRLGSPCLLAGFDVQDLLQEAYIKALRYWPKPLASLTAAQQRAWVSRTAGRLLIDWLRTPERRLRAEPDLSEPDQSAVGSPDLAEQLELRGRLLRVCEHIVKLPKREQEVVTMYALLGYDCEEIAGHLNSSVGSVTTALSRARAKLAKMSGGEEPA